MNSYWSALRCVPVFHKTHIFLTIWILLVFTLVPQIKGNSCGQEDSATLYKRLASTIETLSARVAHVFCVLPVIHREAVILNGLWWREMGRENPIRFRSLSWVWGGMVQWWYRSAGWRRWVGGPHSHLWLLIIGTISKAKGKKVRLFSLKEKKKEKVASTVRKTKQTNVT